MLLAFAGEARLAVSGALVGVGSILLVTWARGFPAREWIATALLFVGIGLVGSPLFALFLLAVAVALQLWLSRRMRRRLPADLEVAGDEVMPGAEEAVAAFEAAGFRRTGAYATQVPQLLGTKRAVVSVLAAAGADRFAVATDRVVEVVSRFGDRWLLTTSSGLAPLTGSTLRQLVARGSPAELAAAHQTALDVLSRRGVEPDPLADGDVVEAALELERTAMAFVADAGLRESLGIEPRRKTSDPVLDDDERSRRRVDDWLAADAPASLQD